MSFMSHIETIATSWHTFRGFTLKQVWHSKQRWHFFSSNYHGHITCQPVTSLISRKIQHLNFYIKDESLRKSYLWISLVPTLLSPDPPCHQPIFDTMCQTEIIISGGGHITIFAKSVVQMLVKSPLQIRNRFHSGQSPNGNLLFPIWIRECCHLESLTLESSLALNRRKDCKICPYFAL